MRKVLPFMLVVGLVLAAAAAAAPGKDISPDVVKKITDALPDKPPAEPAKPRKVLVYSACNGFYHGSIPTGDKCIELMGKKTGAFEATVSNDVRNFLPEKLKEFDAVVLNNTTGDLFMPGRGTKIEAENQAEAKKIAEAARKSLLAFVQGGKGIIGIHAATDCSYKWKEYGEMMGGYFAGHPWSMNVGIENDSPDHPVNAAFDGKGFEVVDEIYQFNRGVYSRQKCRTLLSLDMNKTPNRGQRADRDYAVSWVKTYGKGRVFYCSLGHRNEIFWNPAILRHYLAGIQFAIGDLKAGVEPNPLPDGAKPLPKLPPTTKKAEPACPVCGAKGQEGDYCKKCNAIVTIMGDYTDPNSFAKVKSGAYDKRGRYFLFNPADSPKCPHGMLKGKWCDKCGTYACLSAVLYCTKCRMPFAKDEGECPRCKAKAKLEADKKPQDPVIDEAKELLK